MRHPGDGSAIGARREGEAQEWKCRQDAKVWPFPMFLDEGPPSRGAEGWGGGDDVTSGGTSGEKQE